MWSIRLCGQHGCRTQLTSGSWQHSVHAKSESLGTRPEGRRLACVVELDGREHQLAEQAAADALVREKAQKWCCGAVNFNAQAGFVVANFCPALCHPEPVRGGNKE